MLGGKIRVESIEGKGAKFCVSIPYKRVNSETTTNNLKLSSLNNKFKILIAEDEEINFLYLETVLKKVGGHIHVIRASSGDEAVDLCKQNYPVDMVLMDIRLPGLDGLKATEQIKSLYPNLPVIAQSAYTSNGDIQKSMEAGFDRYLKKPIKREELIQVVKEYLPEKMNK